MFARLLLLALAAAVPLVDVLLAAPQARKARRVAILVGVGKYDHKFSDLGKAPENDVTELAKELTAGGFEVHTLLGRKPDGDKDRATKANVEGRFDEILKTGAKLRDGDTLVVVLCGHGVQDGQPLFCPVDSLPTDPKTMVPLNKLIADAEPYGATALFLVDACRDDPNRGARSGIQGSTATLKTKTAVLYSCKAGQLAFQDDKTGHGVFTFAVLKTIRDGHGTNWDRLVTGVKEAFQSDEIRAMLPPGRVQTPVQANGEIEFTALLPARTVKKSDPPGGGGAMAKGERTEEFEYIVNDTEKKKGKRRVLTVDIGGGQTMEFVRIEPGEFLMGAPDGEQDAGAKEKPQRRVRITKAFYMGMYEVTQAQYQAVTGSNPSGFKGDRLPVEKVDWNDAVDFCTKASARTGRKIALPRDAEWEYACRAGTTTPFSFGSRLNGDHANCDGRTNPYGAATPGEYLQKTTDVGSYRPNPWGLYDMHGNVWEYCEDFDGPLSALPNQPDPVQLSRTSDPRMIRGGSWINSPTFARSASRNLSLSIGVGAGPGRENYNGFRAMVRVD